MRSARSLKLYKKLHRTSSFTRLNAPIIALVNIQCVCDLFLCKTVFDTELPDTFSAVFYVIIHWYNLQSQNLFAWIGLRLEVMGISLCRAATGISVPTISIENDKAERQVVLGTVWRSALSF